MSTGDSPPTRAAHRSTHEIQTTDPADLLRLVKNTVRKLEYDVVADDVEIAKADVGGRRTVSGSLVVEQEAAGEIPIQERRFDERMPYALGGVAVLLVVAALAGGVPAFAVVAAIPAAGAVWIHYEDDEETEHVEYTNRIEIAADGEVHQRKPAVTDGAGSAETSSKLTLEITAESPYPDVERDALADDVETMNEEIVAFTRT